MRRWTFPVIGLAIALFLAFGVSRFASSSPDGLERVAADKSLDSNEAPHVMADGPFAGYETRGVTDPGTSTGVAGVVGVVATFVIAGGLGWVVVRISRRGASRDAGSDGRSDDLVATP